MKTKFYALYACILATSLTINADAQTWRPKSAGLPSGYKAGYLYGEGNGMMATNGAPSSGGDQLMYTTDTTTPLTASPSSFGTYAAVQTGVKKCKGAYFVAGVGGVFKSTDNGHNWTLTSTGAVATSALYAYNDTLYANLSLGAGAISYSADGGTTWTAMTSFPGGAVQRFLKNNGVLYAATSATMYYTADNGITWSSVKSPVGVFGLTAFQGKTYASSAIGIFVTPDNGATWNNVTPQPSSVLITVDTSIIAGSGMYGVFRSDKSGTVWTAVNTGFPPYISTLYRSVMDLTSNDQYIIASASGSDSMIYVLNLGDLGLKPNPTAPPTTGTAQAATNTTATKIFPNPANTTISVVLSNKDAATITLCDAAGCVIKTIKSENGESVKMDVSHVAAGIYLLRVQQGANETTNTVEVTR